MLKKKTYVHAPKERGKIGNDKHARIRERVFLKKKTALKKGVENIRNKEGGVGGLARNWGYYVHEGIR